VYRGDGDLIEEGDYSGFGGAARALAEEPDVAVLETARGGILLRGIGVLHNDVAIVTNVSEDHLGPPRHPDDRSARRGESVGHAHHPSGRMGRAERRRPTRAVDAQGRDRTTVALLARSLASGDPRRPGRTGPRDSPARRVDDRPRRLVVATAGRS
jgi:hypothetical protein